ncbi:class I SAM-dependent RNA methyltransferase [Oscillospiraceae bacterium HV4-5-C5C]|nr:class I SAM-dependent RNA methyltransferase [Oscillospiraceae bacterium HV4-5-C5C]
MDIVLPVIMGLERQTAEEISALGYDPAQIKLENALVRLTVPDEREQLSAAVARLNVFCSTAERVQVELAEFEARDFDSFFDQTAALPWEDWISAGQAFHIKGYSLRSQLFSVTDLQRLLKRAIVKRLQETRYHAAAHVPEDENGPILSVRFAFLNDRCALRVDTSGDSLHKRGYRTEANLAPLKETLAAALLGTMRWRPFTDECFWDPFCGSGTIAIEAARLAAGIAPGSTRTFSGETWTFLDSRAFSDARAEAREAEDLTPPEEPFIYASDLDPQALRIAEANAARARVSEFIYFRQADARALTPSKMKELSGYDRMLIIGNPPYGERMFEQDEVVRLIRRLGQIYLQEQQTLPAGLRIGLISSLKGFEKQFGRLADKRRKLYNGKIVTTFYQYFRALPHTDKAAAGVSAD